MRTDDLSRPGYQHAVRSEWTKYRTIRSSILLTVVLAVAFPAFAVLVAATESLQSDDTILGASVLGGGVLAQLVAASLGAGLVTSEFRTGTIRPTLTACPRRLRVLAAKATVAAGVVFIVTLPSATVAYAIGRAMLDGDRYASGDAFPPLLGVAVAMASVAVLGVGLGTVVRQAGAAVAAVVAVVLLPGMLSPLLGGAQRWVGGASLDGVLQKLTQSSDATHETVGSLAAWPSLGIVAAYTTTTVLGAVWVLRHRDT